MGESHIFVIEMQAAVNAAGDVQTFYACTGDGFATLPSDTPANKIIPPTVADPGALRREMFAGDRVWGQARSTFGEIVLHNSDGRYDDWAGYGFDGWPVVIRMGPKGSAYPADFAVVLQCTGGGITLTQSECRIKLRDASQQLDVSALPESFSGESPAEGSMESLAGEAKHRVLGRTAQFCPPPRYIGMSLGEPIYHVTTGYSESVVLWDNGNQLSRMTSSADFWGTGTIATPGRFVLHNEDGNVFVRLGSRVEGDLRAQCTGMQADGSAWTTAALLAEVGMSAPILSTPPIVGFPIDSASTTYANVLDDLCLAAGYFWGFDRLGNFVSKSLGQPIGSPVFSFNRANTLSIESGPVSGMEAPVGEITVECSKTWKSRFTNTGWGAKRWFDADGFLFKWTEKFSDVYLKHKAARAISMSLAPNVVRTTFINRWRTMFAVDRRSVTVRAPLSSDVMAVDIGDLVRVTWPRFGLNAGRSFIVVSVGYELKQRQIVFTLWG